MKTSVDLVPNLNTEEDNSLREIPPEDFQPLLDDLKLDFPNSIQAWSFLKTVGKWRAYNPTLCVKILAINGDYRTKFIVFYTTRGDPLSVQGTIHKWSHQENDESLVQECLRKTDKVPWRHPSLLMTALTPETAKTVLPVFDELLDGHAWHSRPDAIYWKPKEVAEKWTTEAPQGTYISFLNERHAEEINEVWPHRYNGSLEVITTMTQVNFGMGLFDSETNELMSWALHWFYGAIGVLQTKEQHKKKGYGSVVVKAISQEIAKRGDDVFLNIITTNTASIHLVEKLGFDFLMDGTWIHGSAE